MKALFVLLACLLCALPVLSADPAALLNQQLPPPPVRHAVVAEQQQQADALTGVTSLLSVDAKSTASLAAKAAAEAALAVEDESELLNAPVESHVTEAGQLSLVEQELVATSLANRDLIDRAVSKTAKGLRVAASGLKQAGKGGLKGLRAAGRGLLKGLSLAKKGVKKVGKLAVRGVRALNKLASGKLLIRDRYIDGMWRPRMKSVPGSQIPADPPKQIEYIAPPMNDKLKKGGKYPWPERLQNALNQVTIAADTRIDQIKRQMKWTSQAKKLVNELALKKNKVNSHVSKLSTQIRKLLGKKKQIQNKQLQDKLVTRLQDTHKNLKKLRKQTHNIRKHEAKMIHHKEQLAHAIEGIARSLALLKGMKRKRKFPSIGFGKKKADELAKFDPDLSFEAEADEVRSLAFPDAVLHEAESEVHTAQDEKEDRMVQQELAEE